MNCRALETIVWLVFGAHVVESGESLHSAKAIVVFTLRPMLSLCSIFGFSNRTVPPDDMVDAPAVGSKLRDFLKKRFLDNVRLIGLVASKAIHTYIDPPQIYSVARLYTAETVGNVASEVPD